MKLDAVMEAWMLNFLEEVHTCMPGRIEVYHGNLRARVLPAVRPWLQNGEVVPLKPIDDVPVLLPYMQAGGLRIPPAAGDGVLLVFSEVGFGAYMHGTAKVADADDPSRFSLSDCIAVPGLWPFNGQPAYDAPDDRPWLGSANGASIGLRERVQLQNKVSTLRKELEAVWDVVDDLYTQLLTLAPLTTTSGSPTTPNPAQVSVLTAAKAAALARKNLVKNFAE